MNNVYDTYRALNDCFIYVNWLLFQNPQIVVLPTDVVMDQTEQKFLADLDKKLWNAADKLRSNIDAAEYKHVVLGLIFLKYVSDAFTERREELLANICVTLFCLNKMVIS